MVWSHETLVNRVNRDAGGGIKVKRATTYVVVVGGDERLE